MAKYTGKAAVVNKPIADLYGRFSNLSNLKSALEQNVSHEATKMGEVTVGEDFLSIQNPQVGEIKFQVTERVEPTKVVFKAVNSPLPIGMSINLKELDADSTEVCTVLELEIPAVMRAFVGPKLQQVADKFGEMMVSGAH